MRRIVALCILVGVALPATAHADQRTEEEIYVNAGSLVAACETGPTLYVGRGCFNVLAQDHTVSIVVSDVAVATVPFKVEIGTTAVYACGATGPLSIPPGTTRVSVLLGYAPDPLDIQPDLCDMTGAATAGTITATFSY